MSSAEGKDWIRDRVAVLARHNALSVLDVGPGVGTYATLFSGLALRSMTALEVWEPYVATYGLTDLYDDIILGDVRTTPLPTVDVVVLGDVLEHMTRAEGIAVWNRCGAIAAQAVYLSIPVVHYPQHELEGNPYEVHVEEDWSHERVLSCFEGIGDWWVGDVVGVYERRTVSV